MLNLRRANWSDARVLWEWANDPEVRRMAFQSEPIAWEAHLDWFTRKLANNESLMLVYSNEHGCPLGQIRFDIDPITGDATVDVSISPLHRRNGLGSQMISAGVDEIWSDPRVVRICAIIKAENTASARAFEKAGFKRGPDSLRHGVAVRMYSMERT